MRTTNGTMQARRAFTMAEVLIASAILSITAAALSGALSAGHQQTFDAIRQARAQALAEALLDEIVSLPYSDPEGGTSFGPDSGETSRSLFDDVDDFNGYIEVAGALTDTGGSAYPAVYQEFSRSAATTAESQVVTGFGITNNGVRVVVTVQDAAGRTWTVSRFVKEPG